MKQRIAAKAGKLKRYKARVTQYRQNKLFFCNQKALYEDLDGKGRETSDPPLADDAKKFWSEIRDKPAQYREDAEWLVKVEKELEVVKIPNNVVITKEDVIKPVLKMPNWKSPGLDYIQEFWLKIFSSLHQTIADIPNNVLQSASIPEWMVESRTVLKYPTKGNTVGNYRLIACLNLLWKLLTGIISDRLYEQLENQNLLPEEQKDCRRRSRGTKDQIRESSNTAREGKPI